MTLSEAVKTIRDYCSITNCGNCVFAEDGKFWKVCGLMRHIPVDWKEPPETNIYDQEEIHENATVQILRNSITGEESIGWWENEEAEGGIEHD